MSRVSVDKWGDGGVTVTFVHRETGATRTVVSPGQRKTLALRAACALFDPALWRIGTISTVQTIYDDPTSSRALREKPEWGGHDRAGKVVGRDLSTHIGGVRHPESQMVAQAGTRAWL